MQLDAAWAGIIITVVLTIIGAFVGLWRHAENNREHADQADVALHNRVTNLRTEIEQRFHNTDQAYRQERHNLVDRWDKKLAELQEDIHALEIRCATLERDVRNSKEK